MALAAGPLQAQTTTFTGDQVTSGPFTTGKQEFYDNSVFNANASNSVLNMNGTSTQQRQSYYNNSTINVSATNAITRGFIYLYDNSIMNVTAERSLVGYNTFASDVTINDNATFNALAANVLFGSNQIFVSNYGTVNLSAAGAMSGSSLINYATGTVNITTAGAIIGGSINNRGFVRLAVAEAMTGGGIYQETDTGVLDIEAANAVTGGFLNAAGTINLKDVDAITGGIVTISQGGKLVIDADAPGDMVWSSNVALRLQRGSYFLLNGHDFTMTTGITGGPEAGYYGTIANNAAQDLTITLDTPAQGVAQGGVVFNDSTNGAAGKIAVVKTGPGVFSMQGANRYTGGTRIEEGVLRADYYNANSPFRAFPSHTAWTINGGTLDLNDYDLQMTSLDGTGGEITLGTVSFTQLGIIQTVNTSYAGAISGAGSLGKYGTGTLILTGANTYKGGTLINEGLLQAGSATALSANTAYTVNGGTLDLNSYDLAMSSLKGTGGAITLGSAALAVNQTGNTTYEGAISGTGTLSKSGTGTLSLKGTNTYTGGTTVTAGTLEAASAGALPANTAYTVNGGTLRLMYDLTMSSLDGTGGAVSMANNLTVDQASNTSHAGVIAGNGRLTKSGNGTLVLTGANTYTGVTTVNAGMLQAGNAGALPTNRAYTVNGGTLDLNSYDLTMASLDGTGGAITLGSATLSVAQALNSSYAGAISGTGSLTKSATGRLTLTGSNSFGGDITLNGGTLQFGNQGVGGNTSLDGDIRVTSGTFAIHTAVEAAGQASFANGTTLEIAAFANPALQAEDVTLGSNVRLNLAGISSPSDLDKVLINTNSGITGDFGSVSVGGFNGVVDYLTVNTRKSADNMQYLASYDLSWTARNSLAHGTFTLTDASNSFVVGAVLGDEAANPATGWNGKTLTKAGNGTLILTGNNTYTGTTVISGGTLQLGAGGASGSIIGDVANNGTLAFNRSNEVYFYPGVISGSGSVSQIGSGLTIFITNHTYTGNTVITNGILRVGDGGNQGWILGNVANESILAFNRYDDVTFPGVISGSGRVEHYGEGTLTFTGNNTYTGVTFAMFGTLQIGDGGTTGSLAGDINSTEGAIIFNRSNELIVPGEISGGASVSQIGSGTTILTRANTYYSGTTITAGTLVGTANSFGWGEVVNNAAFVIDQTTDAAFDNVLAGTGTFRKIGAGIVDMTADNSGFTGATTIEAGGLAVNDVLGGTMDILAGGRLQGNGTVGDTTNAGIIAPGNSIGTLTIAGNYTGNNGVLAIEAVLGDDHSQSDKLVITGDVSGSTNVKVINLGGAGAQTDNGIQIISVAGLSPADAFMLSGDYVTTDGQQAVIGGAYAYTLQHGGTNTTTDGQWYLTSQLRPVVVDDEVVEAKGSTGGGLRYQPGVPLYEQYGQVLASLNTLPTLQERVGNRYWSEGQGAAGNSNSGNYGMWGRVEGQRMAANPARSDTLAHRDIDLWKLQTGFDFVLNQSAAGVLIGGVNVSHGTALAEIGSPFGRGKIDTRSTGIGATLTWYGESGLYVDAQAQAMWFDSDITSTTLGRKLAKGNKGNGYALSVETGNRFQFGNGFSVTPQVQLTWSRVDFKSFTDPFGTYVSSQNGDSLRMRLGVSLDHEASWVAADGTKSRTHVYGIANLYNEFLKGNKVSVAHIPFRSRDERLWAGLGLGATYEWNDGRYAIFGTANLAGSLQHMSRNYNLGATIGFRAKW